MLPAGWQVNKLAVHHLPLPGIVTSCQFSLCSVVVFGCKLCGWLHMDDFEWDKAKYYLVYVLSFTIGTYTNMKVLSMANVETVIVFRSCTPLAVAFFDTIFYNRALPGLRSTLSLFLITIGAVAYIMTDREFHMHGSAAYKWVCIWWVVLVFQLTYGKFLVTGIPLASLWTPVLYTNTFSILPALCVCMLAGELSPERLEHVEVTNTALFWLLASCAIGIGISWAGFWCQSLVSATTYTVVGVMNKMLTVTVNVLIWDKHASATGIGALGLWCARRPSLGLPRPPSGLPRASLAPPSRFPRDPVAFSQPSPRARCSCSARALVLSHARSCPPALPRACSRAAYLAARCTSRRPCASPAPRPSALSTRQIGPTCPSLRRLRTKSAAQTPWDATRAAAASE